MAQLNYAMPERYWRTSTAMAMRKVAALAGLDDQPWMQDWPLEVADRNRVFEFIKLFESVSNSEERFVLMQLILFSIDECDEDQRRALWPTVASLLEQDPTEHAHALIYWSCLRERDDGRYEFNTTPDENFNITPLMQKTLARVKDALSFSELDIA